MSNNNTPWYKRFFKPIYKNKDTIFHWVVLIILSKYIITNWNECISMQFFSDFDGNNILFILWLVLIFLMLYDIEAKDIKLKQHRFNKNFENITMRYNIDSMAQNISQQTSANLIEEQETGNNESQH